MGLLVKDRITKTDAGVAPHERMEDLTVEWGVASRALPGQTESGDMYIVETFDGGILIGVVDGLGHGAEAAQAARLAIQVLSDNADKSVITLLNKAHEVLRTTRGAVMSIASFRSVDRSLSWLSVGNVEGILHRGDPASTPAMEMTLLRGGVVGYQIPPPFASIYSVAAGDTLIFATDGVRNFMDALNGVSSITPAQLAERICSQYARETDDALVLVVRFVVAEHARHTE